MTALPFLAPEDTALAVRVTNQTGADASLLPGFSWVSPPADDTPIAKAGAAGLGLYVSPAEWDFGNVEFGKQYQTELGLKSESAAPLAISEVLIAGPDADDFAEPVVTCPGGTPLPAVLANGEFCTVDVTFLPPHGGQKDAQVWIHTDLPDAEWIYAPMSALAGPQFKLEVVLDPLAGGSATGEWIECAAGSEDCSVMLDKGTSEKLTAEPAEWYKFVSW
jgi:hypothetical protein